MVLGDWYVLAITAVIVGVFGYRLVSERQKGITGLRADLSPQRAMIGAVVALLIALAMLAGALLALRSDALTTGTGRLLAGVRLHHRAFVPLLLAITAFFAYLATQLYRRARGTEPVVARVVTDDSALTDAQTAWSEALEEPDPKALSQA